MTIEYDHTMTKQRRVLERILIAKIAVAEVALQIAEEDREDVGARHLELLRLRDELADVRNLHLDFPKQENG